MNILFNNNDIIFEICKYLNTRDILNLFNAYKKNMSHDILILINDLYSHTEDILYIYSNKHCYICKMTGKQIINKYICPADFTYCYDCNNDVCSNCCVKINNASLCKECNYDNIFESSDHDYDSEEECHNLYYNRLSYDHYDEI